MKRFFSRVLVVYTTTKRFLDEPFLKSVCGSRKIPDQDDSAPALTSNADRAQPNRHSFCNSIVSQTIESIGNDEAFYFIHHSYRAMHLAWI